MAPEKVSPSADGRPVEHVLPAANLDPSQLTNPRPPATVAGSEVTQAEGQGAWAWASAELKRKMRDALRAEAQTGEPSPARRFGAGFGAIGLGEMLGLSPSRKIEKLETAQETLARRMEALEASKAKPKRQRRKQKFGGKGKKKDNDYWLDRWANDVGYELKKEECPPQDRQEQMMERVYRLKSKRAAKEINDRYRKFNHGKDVVSASSLRRRLPPLLEKDSEGQPIRILGNYICKRWADWAVHRNEEEMGDSLADGSTKMPLPDDDDAGDSPAIEYPAATVTRRPAAPEDVDDRKRSLFDGSLETATIKDQAKQAVVEGKLSEHEGGQGVTHVRPPKIDREALQDQQERKADEILHLNGINPHAVHNPRPRERRKTTSVD